MVLLTERGKYEQTFGIFLAVRFMVIGLNFNERPDSGGIYQYNRQAKFSGFIFFAVIRFSAFLRFSHFLAN